MVLVLILQACFSERGVCVCVCVKERCWRGCHPTGETFSTQPNPNSWKQKLELTAVAMATRTLRYRVQPVFQHAKKQHITIFRKVEQVRITENPPQTKPNLPKLAPETNLNEFLF